jgi:hypothetical protein
MDNDNPDPRSLTAAYIDKHHISELFEVTVDAVRRARPARSAPAACITAPGCMEADAHGGNGSCLQMIIAELLIQKPEEPRAFTVAYLEQLKTRGAQHFCSNDDLAAMFGLFDATRKGSITAGVWRQRAQLHACCSRPRGGLQAQVPGRSRGHAGVCTHASVRARGLWVRTGRRCCCGSLGGVTPVGPVMQAKPTTH